MGFLSRIGRAPPLTTIGAADNHETVVKTRGTEKEENASVERENVSASQSHIVNPEMERRVIRKMDMRVVPLVMALYILAFLDRSNIGNARIAGMRKELQLDVGNRYQWLLTIFYITYILFEWQVLMWKLLPPHAWATFAVFGWGIAATAQAGAQSWKGVLVSRFFLGIFEAVSNMLGFSWPRMGHFSASSFGP